MQNNNNSNNDETNKIAENNETAENKTETTSEALISPAEESGFSQDSEPQSKGDNDSAEDFVEKLKNSIDDLLSKHLDSDSPFDIEVSVEKAEDSPATEKKPEIPVKTKKQEKKDFSAIVPVE